MKGYYIGGAVLAFLLFIVLFFVGLIGTCAGHNARIDEVKDYGKSTVAVRYFTSDSDEASIKYFRQEKNTHFEIAKSDLPKKLGYNFLGFASDRMGVTFFVDKNGKSLRKLTEDVLLYPIFEKVQGETTVSFRLRFEHLYGNLMVSEAEVSMSETSKQIDLSSIDYSSYLVEGYALGGFKLNGVLMIDATGKLLDGKTLEDVWDKTLTAVWVEANGAEGGNN